MGVFVCFLEVSAMIRSAWLSVIPVVLAVGCGSKPVDLPYAQRTTLEDTVRQVAEEFLRRSESGDVASWMALFSSDESMRYAMGGSVWGTIGGHGTIGVGTIVFPTPIVSGPPLACAQGSVGPC